MRILKTDTSARWDPATMMVLISCGCLAVQLISMPFKITFMMSLANHGLLWSWILIGGYFIVRKMIYVFPLRSIYSFLVLILTFFSCGVAILQSSANAIENITLWVQFSILPIMFMFYASYEVHERAKRIILLTNFILSLYFIYLFNSDKAYLFPTDYDYDYQLDAATLGYPNPNQTAMYLFVCVSNLLISFFYVKRKLIKSMLIVDMVYITQILYKTESRTAILVIGFVIVTALYMLFKQIPKVWIKFVLVIPILYVLFAQFWIGAFEGITFMGEEILTGREQIYSIYFSNLNPLNFFLGDYSRFQYDNMHNGYLSLAATSGILAFGCFVLMLNSELTESYQYKAMANYQKAAFSAFLGIILYSCTEAAMFVSGSSYAALIFTTYLMFSRPYKRGSAGANEDA